MKIIKLSISNYLCFDFWKSDNLGNLIHITGGNGKGKSSFIKAIKEVFKSSGSDADLIRIGEDKAEIMVSLDTGIEIQRRIGMGGNTVKVTKNGQPLEKPQALLNSLIGGLQFNPIDFMLAKTKQRMGILLSAMPFTLNYEQIVELLPAIEVVGGTFDFSKHGLEVLDDIQKHVYERRHEQGIEVDQLKKSIRQDRQDIPETLDEKKFEGFNLNAKIEERSTMEGVITAQKKDEESLDALRDLKTEKENDIKRKEDELIRLKSELADIQSRGSALNDKCNDFKPPQVDLIIAEIDEYQEFQKFGLKLEAIQQKEIDLEKSDAVRTSLDELYKALTNEIPKKLLAEIKLPIQNLEIDGDKILIKGVPIDKMSDSEQIRFSIEIAEALAGDLDAICIDRFETLEEKNRLKFLELASKPHPQTGKRFQYFITEVTSGDLQVNSQNGQAEMPPEKPPTEKQRGF